MLVKFPNKILIEGEEYQLYLEYRMNCKKMFKWLVSYVGDHGLYYQDEDDDLDMLYERFVQNVIKKETNEKDN